MGITLNKLGFDPTDLAESHAIGSYIIGGGGEVVEAKTIAASDWLQVASALFDGSGNAISSTGGALDVNIASGTVTADMDGIYNGATNTDPDNIGLIGHTRAASPADAEQVERITVGTANADDVVAANVHGLDVNSFLMGYDGSTWDRVTVSGGALDFNFASQDSDINVNITNAAVDVEDSVSSVKATAATVGTSAVQIAATPLSSRRRLIIQNLGTKTIYLGEANTVTTGTGVAIPRGDSIDWPINATGVVWAISGTAGQDVRVFEGA